MIDINKIRHLSTYSKDYKIFKEALQKRIEAEASAGQWQTEVVYINGGYTVWNFEVVNMAVKELRKDGFHVEYRENPVVMEKCIVIDWVEPYADTDSVKLPEVAQTCNTCRWYNVTRIPPCDMGNKPENPNVQGCNLYESED